MQMLLRECPIVTHASELNKKNISKKPHKKLHQMSDIEEGK